MKEFWFKFLTSPSEYELRILDAVIQKCDGLDAQEKVVLMSPFDPRLATVASPFFLSLNAFLVLSGNSHVFTRFCQDKRMLKLQRVARENQIGPLYCALTRNHVIEIEVDTSDDVNLSPFAAVNFDRLRNQGYPDWKNEPRWHNQWPPSVARASNEANSVFFYEIKGKRSCCPTSQSQKSCVWILHRH